MLTLGKQRNRSPWRWHTRYTTSQCRRPLGPWWTFQTLGREQVSGQTVQTVWVLSTPTRRWCSVPPVKQRWGSLALCLRNEYARWYLSLGPWVFTAWSELVFKLCQLKPITLGNDLLWKCYKFQVEVIFFFIWMTQEKREVINISEYLSCARIRIKRFCRVCYL